MFRAFLLLAVGLLIPACACTDHRSGGFHACNEHHCVVKHETCECSAACPCYGRH